MAGLVLASLVGGCGGDEEGTAATAGGGEPTIEIPQGLVSVPWSHEATQGDGRFIRISFDSWNARGCPKFERYVVKETDAVVLIAVLMRPAGGDCPQPTPDTSRADIPLEDPLGGRGLAHAPVTQE